MNLSKVLDAAVKERHIKENLLKFSKAIRPDTSDNEIFYLSEESLLTLYDAPMLTRLERGVVNAFILMAFTGFAYSDYMEFRVNPNEFIICENGTYFLKKRRYKDRFHKNPVIPIIPYMQIHKTILDRYEFNLPYLISIKNSTFKKSENCKNFID